MVLYEMESRLLLQCRNRTHDATWVGASELGPCFVKQPGDINDECSAY